MKTDPQAGTITLIVKAIGLSTRQLCAMEKGQSVTDLLGPLGKPSDIEKYGTVVIVGGGVGTAVAFAVAEVA